MSCSCIQRHSTPTWLPCDGGAGTKTIRNMHIHLQPSHTTHCQGRASKYCLYNIGKTIIDCFQCPSNHEAVARNLLLNTHNNALHTISVHVSNTMHRPNVIKTPLSQRCCSTCTWRMHINVGPRHRRAGATVIAGCMRANLQPQCTLI